MHLFLHSSIATKILRVQEALVVGINDDNNMSTNRFKLNHQVDLANDSDILVALRNLPRGLSEVLDRKLCRVRKRLAARESLKALQFCGVVKQPLKIMEYRESLSISPGQKSLNRASFANDMDQIILDCCGLVSVDEEDNTLHYVHHSVKQHLFTERKHSEDFNVSTLDFKHQLVSFKKGSNRLSGPASNYLLRR